MFIAHLHQRLRLYTIGWMNLNIHPHVMHLIQDVQLRLLRQKSSIKSIDIILVQRIKVREFVEVSGISHSTVISILHEQLKKLSARWVRLLTVDHKRDRVTILKQCLEIFQPDEFPRNPNEFLRRFITVDETWIHYFTSETKEQLKQWTSRMNQFRRRRRP